MVGTLQEVNQPIPNKTHLAGHALFAVCALPLVAGDVVDEVEVEADAGRVARGVALGTVQKHLRLQGKWSDMSDGDVAYLSCSVVVHVPLAVLADRTRPHFVHLLHWPLRLLLHLLLHLLLLDLHLLPWSAPDESKLVRR